MCFDGVKSNDSTTAIELCPRFTAAQVKYQCLPIWSNYLVIIAISLHNVL